MLRRLIEALCDTDVWPLLGRISAQILVLHRRGDRAVRIGAGRHVASRIAQAPCVELDGRNHWIFAGEQGSVLESIGGLSAGSWGDRAVALDRHEPNITKATQQSVLGC